MGQCSSEENSIGNCRNCYEVPPQKSSRSVPTKLRHSMGRNEVMLNNFSRSSMRDSSFLAGAASQGLVAANFQMLDWSSRLGLYEPVNSPRSSSVRGTLDSHILAAVRASRLEFPLKSYAPSKSIFVAQESVKPASIRSSSTVVPRTPSFSDRSSHLDSQSSLLISDRFNVPRGPPVAPLKLPLIDITEKENTIRLSSAPLKRLAHRAKLVFTNKNPPDTFLRQPNRFSAFNEYGV